MIDDMPAWSQQRDRGYCEFRIVTAISHSNLLYSHLCLLRFEMLLAEYQHIRLVYIVSPFLIPPSSVATAELNFRRHRLVGSLWSVLNIPRVLTTIELTAQTSMQGSFHDTWETRY